MTKNFTTPEFTDLLKQHGIEIDTPFYSFVLKYEDDITNIMFGMYSASLGKYVSTNGWTYNEDDVEQIKPAYLLSKVLAWLPDTVIIKGISCSLEVIDAQISKFRYNGRTYSESVQRGWLPVEQLIAQGFTEGWLTKEIIEQQIKQNQ